MLLGKKCLPKKSIELKVFSKNCLKVNLKKTIKINKIDILKNLAELNILKSPKLKKSSKCKKIW